MSENYKENCIIDMNYKLFKQIKSRNFCCHCLTHEIYFQKHNYQSKGKITITTIVELPTHNNNEKKPKLYFQLILVHIFYCQKIQMTRCITIKSYNTYDSDIVI